MKLYTNNLKTYSWGSKDHDPIIDQMRTLVEDEGVSYKKVSELSGLSVTTLNNWFNRKITGKRKPTMRPQFSSVMAMTRSLGYDMQIVKTARRTSAAAGVKLTRNVAAKADVGLNTNL